MVPRGWSLLRPLRGTLWERDGIYTHSAPRNMQRRVTPSSVTAVSFQNVTEDPVRN